MRKYYLIIASLICSITGFSQCPTVNIELSTQADIDDFAINYPNCTQLTHDLEIDGAGSNITNLNGLSAITDAHEIFILATQIPNLSGISNLVTVDHFALWGNSNLQNMDGLSSLQVIGGLEIYINGGIESLSGMDNLQSLDRLSLFGNPNLSDISDLSFVQSLSAITMGGNALTSLSGLENLHTVLEDISISSQTLQNFNELSSLQVIGGSLLIIDNDQIQDLSAFSNINTLVDLYVVNCLNLSDLSGLENIQTVTGKLRIGLNPEIIDLIVFSNISSVGNLDIYENQSLETLRGLENLIEINDRLLILDNPNLHTIEAIRNVSPELIDEVDILNNTSLSICGNQFICAIIDDATVTKVITNNNTGCNSIQEVQDACELLAIGDITLDNMLLVYPNPVSNMLTLSISESISFEKVSVYSIIGQQLLETSETEIDFSDYSDGVYLLNIATDKGVITHKVVKE